jgi:glycosyltransferase involved in cell wall biosynthesis
MTTAAPALAVSERIRVRAKFFFRGEHKFFLKGITYGPFKPDAAGDFVGTPEQLRRDLLQMRELGVNLLRIYHVPPAWFLDGLAEFGMLALISIPWAEHIEFLNDRKTRHEIVRTIREGVSRHRGHPAIFGYLVGNEIPTTMVRWLGVRQVTEFLERLINVARAADPEALFSYASYPPTEYLLPQNVDFCTFNVYLHNQGDFENYLLRLQNLADDKPCIMGEFGMDTIRHPEEEHADMLNWHVESVVRCGLAGTIIYAWTDEWFTGGMEITDWAFGVVTRERRPKKAFFALKDKWGGADNEHVTRRVKLPSYPKVSVIVCSYNGAQTLEGCIESLLEIDYPNYEIVLVDDGSTDRTPDIVAKFTGHPKFVPVRQKNMGLSYARNVGAKTATGEIFAYTDGDCMADPDWLYYLVGTLLSGPYAGVGGPNISPPAANWVQACVAAAPGGPSHVLLTDVVAEHIPGCNMAFHRWAFEMVGGFDPEYRKAGDDVDFCWRLQNAGQVIAFSAAAIVWHYRRFTLKAFRKQQEGYGEAESMLRFNHLIFFGPTGTAQWKGNIYGAPRFTWLINQPVVYHGVFGHGLFQSIYPTPRSVVADYVSSVEWFALTLFIFTLAYPLEKLRIVPFLMFGATFLVALSYMIHARLEAKFDTIPARIMVMMLAFVQPLVRGWARYYTWLKFKRTPGSVIMAPHEYERSPSRWISLTNRRYWNETGVGREALIEEVVRDLETENWRYSTDTGWKNWDIQIYGNLWWNIQLKTVTEYHGGPKCLTRVRLSYSPVVATVLLNVIMLLAIAYRQLFTHTPLRDYWVLGAYALFVAFLYYRAFQLKLRVADLVETAAHKCGLGRVVGRPAKPKKVEPKADGKDDATGAADPSPQPSPSPQPAAPSPQPSPQPEAARH